MKLDVRIVVGRVGEFGVHEAEAFDAAERRHRAALVHDVLHRDGHRLESRI